MATTGNLDKQSRIKREQAEREAALQKRVRRLDPRWPYRMEPFDAGFFGVPQVALQK